MLLFARRRTCQKTCSSPRPSCPRIRAGSRAALASTAENPTAPVHVGAAPGGEDDAAPPYVLMEAPPLAVFVNGVLAALNELRHCAPLALRDLFAARLQVRWGAGPVMAVLVVCQGLEAMQVVCASLALSSAPRPTRP